MAIQVDMGGLDLYVNNVYTGNSAPGKISFGSLGNSVTSATMTSTTLTLTTLPTLVTTQALTTAATTSVTLLFPLTGLVSGTPVQLQPIGGTNTITNFNTAVISTAGQINVTLSNNSATAFNGTFIFLISSV